MSKKAIGDGTNLETAIDDAVSKALEEERASSPVTDTMISWKLLEVTGQRGGIASLHTVTVKIEYSGNVA